MNTAPLVDKNSSTSVTSTGQLGSASSARPSGPRGPASTSQIRPATASTSATGHGSVPPIRGTVRPGFSSAKGQSGGGPSTSSAGTSASAKPTGSFSGNSIIVSNRQRGNPLLESIRNVPWEYGDIVPDYVMGKSTCALFLSLKYHNLNPEYIHERLKLLGKSYSLRVLLVLIDVKDPHHPLKELAKMTIIVDITMIPAWSPEEAGKYIEMYKIYENKPADMIQAHVDGDYQTKLTEALTTIKSVNKTDVKTLSTNFQTFRGMTEASQSELSLLPGFGQQKAKRIFDAFHQPFVRNKKPASQQEPSTSQG